MHFQSMQGAMVRSRCYLHMHGKRRMLNSGDLDVTEGAG